MVLDGCKEVHSGFEVEEAFCEAEDARVQHNVVLVPFQGRRDDNFTGGVMSESIVCLIDRYVLTLNWDGVRTAWTVWWLYFGWLVVIKECQKKPSFRRRFLLLVDRCDRGEVGACMLRNRIGGLAGS